MVCRTAPFEIRFYRLFRESRRNNSYFHARVIMEMSYDRIIYFFLFPTLQNKITYIYTITLLVRLGFQP